jgi:type IV pilus assembly protein PilX
MIQIQRSAREEIMTTAITYLTRPAYCRTAQRQQGAALFVSLMFLIILTLIGLSAANVGIMQERMAGNVRETNEAFQSAEATLREVENAVRESVEGTGGAALGIVPQWSELTAANAIDHRSNCTLSQSDPVDHTWTTAPDTGHKFTIYRASGGIAPSGEFFGSACSPLVSTGAVPNKEFDNVHVVVTRAPTRPGGANEEFVSSIFNW